MINDSPLQTASVTLFGAEGDEANKTSGALKLLVTLIVLAVIGVGGFYGYQYYLKLRNPAVYLINGLDRPMTVAFNGEKVEVAGRKFETRVMNPGSYDLVVTNGSGEEVAKEHVEIPGFTKVVAYNIGGVAFLRESTVTFRAARGEAVKEEITYPLGETFITRKDMDYVFTAPPQDVSVRGAPALEKRRFFGFPAQLDSQVPWQWEGTVGYLLIYQEKPDQALQSLLKVARLDPKNARLWAATIRIWDNCTTFQDFPFVIYEKCGSVFDLIGMSVKASEVKPPDPVLPPDGSGEGSGAAGADGSGAK